MMHRDPLVSYSSSSDSDDRGRGSVSPAHPAVPPADSKKSNRVVRAVRRKGDSEGRPGNGTGPPVAAFDGPMERAVTVDRGRDAGRVDGRSGEGGEAMQLVQSSSEANALVKRLRQLESENASLASMLSKICDENCKLTAQVLSLEERCTALAQTPLVGTSVLQSLFAADQGGWFSGGKTAIREKIEHTLEALQNEFLEYKMSHSSTNAEVQALITELQAAHMNASALSKTVQEQQQVISSGPLQVRVRVVSCETEADSFSVSDLRRTLSSVQAMSNKLQAELTETQQELRAKVSECARLTDEVKTLRDATAKGQSVAVPPAQVRMLEQDFRRLGQENTQLKIDLERLQKQLHNSGGVPQAPPTSADPRVEELSSRLSEAVAQAQEASRRANESQQLADKFASELKRCEGELRAAQRAHEVEPQTRVVAAATSEQAAAPPSSIDTLHSQRFHVGDSILDEAAVMAVLDRNKELIAQLESDNSKLRDDLVALREYAEKMQSTHQQSNQSIGAEQQRVTFLLKKTAGLTADMKAMEATNEALQTENAKSQVEIGRLRRQVEELGAADRRSEELERENKKLTERLETAVQLEERLVKAKETIAFMELSQTGAVQMSEFAALQAECSSLQGKLEPLQRSLEAAAKDKERLLAEVAGQHEVIHDLQDRLVAAEGTAREAVALRERHEERAQEAVAERDSMASVNLSLEKQMKDMEGGIKEMAMQMDREREKAKRHVEEQYRAEIEALQAKVAEQQGVLEKVQARSEGTVPVELHDALVAERDRLGAEISKRVLDVEKLKSEILIYRQTISDMEQENEGHTREIEAFQLTRTRDAEAAEMKVLAEQRKQDALRQRIAELEANLSTVTEQRTALATSNEALKQTLQEETDRLSLTAAKHEDVAAKVVALEGEVSRLRNISHEDGVRAAPDGGTPPGAPHGGSAAADSSQQLYHLKCENDKLRGEVKRLNGTNKELNDAFTRLENQVAQRGKSGSAPHAGRTLGAVAEAAGDSVSTLRLALSQAQQDLTEQRQLNAKAAATYSQAMDDMEAEVARLNERVVELEKQQGAVAAAGDPVESEAAAEEPVKARRLKKKKKTLASLVDACESEDISAAPPLPSGPDHPGGGAPHDAATEHLEQETAALREEIAALTAEVESLTEKLRDAQGDLDLANEASAREREADRQRIDFLESQLKSSAEKSSSSVSVGPSGGSGSRRGSLLKLAATVAPGDANVLLALQAQLADKEKEIASLVKQLVPMKNKLAQHMALADRLGIEYPFSEEMMGTAVLRLKALHVEPHTGRMRAVSAPRKIGGADSKRMCTTGPNPMQADERSEGRRKVVRRKKKPAAGDGGSDGELR